MSINCMLTVLNDQNVPLYCLAARYEDGRDAMGPAIAKLVGDRRDLTKLAMELPSALQEIAPGDYQLRGRSARDHICYTLYKGDEIYFQAFGGNDLEWSGRPIDFMDWLSDKKGWEDPDW
jgi:hypothetical protein